MSVPPLEHARQVARSLGSGSTSFVPAPPPPELPAAMYRRICSTVTNGPGSQVATPVSPTPWDMIEMLSRSNAEYSYQVVPRPDIVSSSEDEQAEDEETQVLKQVNINGSNSNLIKPTEFGQPQSSNSSFCLSEALEDMKQLDCAEGSQLVRPLEELRAMLVNVDVPIRERLEILKNLQLRDNWLGFMAKHFRRALNKINSEEDLRAQRVRRLQEIFAELAPPSTRHQKRRSSPASSFSGLPPRPPSSSQSSPPMSRKASPSLVPSVLTGPTSSNHAHKIGTPVMNLPTVQEGAESGSTPAQTPQSAKPLKAPMSERRLPKVTGEKPSEGSSSITHASLRGPMALVPPVVRSSVFSGEREVWQVSAILATAPGNMKGEGSARFCTCLLTDHIGLKPLPTSGLTHFSRSCEERAQRG